MKQLIITLVFVFLGTQTWSQSPDVTSLRNSLLSDTPIEADLQELCDEIGGRVTGSFANEQSVDWAYDKFKEIGVDVWKQEFEMPVLWMEENTRAHVVGQSARFDISSVAKYQTAPGKHQGVILYLNI